MGWLIRGMWERVIPTRIVGLILLSFATPVSPLLFMWGRVRGITASEHDAPPPRIHVLTIGTADATLPESRRVFAMVDNAEGIAVADGSDPRCPQRTATMPDDVGAQA